jgi:hypothetical protein
VGDTAVALRGCGLRMFCRRAEATLRNGPGVTRLIFSFETYYLRPTRCKCAPIFAWLHFIQCPRRFILRRLGRLLGMFTAVTLERIAPTTIAISDAEFWAVFYKNVCQFDLSTKDLQTAHERCDFRLIEKIHLVIEPVLGPEGFRTEAWFENDDYFGDGVRSLEFDMPRFEPSLIEPLHRSLAGEHERFCILAKFYRFSDAATEPLGALALSRRRIIVTQSLVRDAEHA